MSENIKNNVIDFRAAKYKGKTQSEIIDDVRDELGAPELSELGPLKIITTPVPAGSGYKHFLVIWLKNDRMPVVHESFDSLEKLLSVLYKTIADECSC